MRLPRHDTLLSLPALPPRDGLLGDEALLEQVGTEPLVRWWTASAPAVVVGLGLHHRLASVIDVERCRETGVEIVERRAGGGAVWLDEHMLCGALCVPTAQLTQDVTEAYRWLGDLLASALGGRRVEVAEARAQLNALRDACYGALSPHEVVDRAGRKIVGLAQVRRRHAALFQIGILCDGRDQSALADFMLTADRAALRTALQQRSGALHSTPQQAFEVVSAVFARDARPFVP